MCVCAKSLQSCLTLCDPMDGSLPGSSVHEILQVRILEWVAMPSSRGSSPLRDWTCVPCTGLKGLDKIVSTVSSSSDVRVLLGEHWGEEVHVCGLSCISVHCLWISWLLSVYYWWIWGNDGVGHGNPLQDCCLKNSIDRGAWWAAVHGVTKSRTWLNTHSLGNWIPKQGCHKWSQQIIAIRVSMTVSGNIKNRAEPFLVSLPFHG